MPPTVPSWRPNGPSSSTPPKCLFETLSHLQSELCHNEMFPNHHQLTSSTPPPVCPREAPDSQLPLRHEKALDMTNEISDPKTTCLNNTYIKRRAKAQGLNTFTFKKMETKKPFSETLAMPPRTQRGGADRACAFKQLHLQLYTNYIIRFYKQQHAQLRFAMFDPTFFLLDQYPTLQAKFP